MKLEDLTPDHCRRSLGRIKHRAQRTVRDTWFHYRNGTLGRLVIVVGSGYRVGSTWLTHMLRDLAHCKPGIKSVPAELNRFGTLVLRPEAYDYLDRLRGQVIFKSHSLPPSSAALASNAAFVSIYRDPRDALVSASFFFAHLRQEVGGWDEASCRLSVQERIQMLVEGRSPLPVLPRLEQWFRTPFAYKVTYEDLKSQPVEELGRLAGFIGLSTTQKATEEIVSKHDFETRSGRRAGEAREDHLRMRKGIVGDWRNYFDQACIDAFKTQRDGHWNRLLVEMGYEDSPDWA
jgi:hypothetical protein